jgi:hypothetical protein
MTKEIDWLEIKKLIEKKLVDRNKDKIKNLAKEIKKTEKDNV